MPTEKKAKEKDVVFPENITSVVYDIVKGYISLETQEEAVKKILKGEETKGGKMAEIIKKAATGEILIKNLPTVLKDSFNLSIERAKDLAKHLEEKVLVLAQIDTKNAEGKGEPKTQVLKKSSLPKVKSSTPIGKNTYQEPIEE